VFPLHLSPRVFVCLYVSVFLARLCVPSPLCAPGPLVSASCLVEISQHGTRGDEETTRQEEETHFVITSSALPTCISLYSSFARLLVSLRL